jgi:DNA repair protein RadC
MTTTTYDYTPIFTLKMIRNRSVKVAHKVSDQSMAARVLQAYFADKPFEQLVSLLLDGNHNLLGLTVVATGGIAGCHIRPRDVFHAAIIGRASAIILSHNHPSSSLEPSQEDITFNDKVKEMGDVLGCPLLDHIIVSSGIHKGYRSFMA